MLEWYAVVTCRDVHFEDLTVRRKRTDNRCPILSSLSAPDGNQQGPCMGFPVCSPWQAVHAHYMSVSLYYILVRSRLYQVGRFVILWGMLTSVRCKIGWFVRPAESIRIKAHQNVFWWTSDSGSWAVSICLFSWVVHVQEQDSSGIMTCKMTCRCLRFRQSTAATGLDLDGFCSLFRWAECWNGTPLWRVVTCTLKILPCVVKGRTIAARFCLH